MTRRYTGRYPDGKALRPGTPDAGFVMQDILIQDSLMQDFVVHGFFVDCLRVSLTCICHGHHR